MSGLPWYRMYTEFASDPKVQSMDEPSQRRFVMLLCLKCDGCLPDLTDDEVACALRISVDDAISTKELFIKKGFIGENWDIIKWDKRQYKSDNSAERTRAWRERQREKKQSDNSETSQERHDTVTVTPPDTDTDTDNTPLAPQGEKCPHSKIIELYHRILPELPSVQVWNAQSKKNLSSRWREGKDRQSLEWWETFFRDEIRSRPFLMGKVKDFKANLGWIVGPKNFSKIMNGQYPKENDRKQGGTPSWL